MPPWIVDLARPLDLFREQVFVLVLSFLSAHLFFFAGTVARRLRKQIKAPSAIPLLEDYGIEWLGIFERTLFFAVFWIQAYLLAGAWLAFKVASKWEVWQNITKVPENVGGLTAIENLRRRDAWATNVQTRFLIGTLFNLLCAGLGVLMGKILSRLWGVPLF